MALTDTAIKNAKPLDKQYRLLDGNGLYLLIRPNGNKWWRQDYRFDGKDKTLSLTRIGTVACKQPMTVLFNIQTKNKNKVRLPTFSGALQQD